MTRVVHSFLASSIGYACVGIPCPHNRSQIIVLRFPEWNAMSARGYPFPTLTR